MIDYQHKAQLFSAKAAHRGKVLLICTNTVFDEDRGHSYSFNLSLATIAGAMTSAGYVVDTRLLYLPWRADWHPDQERLDEYVAVGITINSAQVPPAVVIARQLKACAPRLPLIAGGAHATFAPEELVAVGFDYVITGEAERPLVALLDVLTGQAGAPELDQIHNLVRRGHDGGVRKNCAAPIEDLDALPLPSWNQDDFEVIVKSNTHDRLASVSKYEFMTGGERLMGRLSLESSRGCPFPCVFCTTNKVKGKLWRSKSAARIVNEYLDYVEFLRRTNPEEWATPGRVYVSFVDDNFSHDRARVFELCDELKKIPHEIRPLWGAMCRAQAVRDRELTAAMADAGCIRIYIGAECGYQDGLKRVGKGLTIQSLDQASDVVATVSGLRRAIFSWILGFPWETKALACRTILKAVELQSKSFDRIRCEIYTLTPYAGSDVVDLLGAAPSTGLQDVERDTWGFAHPNMTDDDCSELRRIVDVVGAAASAIRNDSPESLEKLRQVVSRLLGVSESWAPTQEVLSGGHSPANAGHEVWGALTQALKKVTASTTTPAMGTAGTRVTLPLIG